MSFLSMLIIRFQSVVLFFFLNVEQRYYQFDTKINYTFNRDENFFLLFSFFLNLWGHILRPFQQHAEHCGCAVSFPGRAFALL